MDDIVPGIVICGSFIMIFGGLLGFFAYLRYIRYKETLALAEKGLVRTRYESNGVGTLRWGIALTGIGLALCIGLYPFGWLTAAGTFPLNFGPWMLIGLIPTFFGLSLIAIYLVTREKEDDELVDQASISAETFVDEGGEAEEGSAT